LKLLNWSLLSKPPGAAWRFLPAKYPSPTICWRRLKQWEETSLDGSFASVKKGLRSRQNQAWRRDEVDGTLPQRRKPVAGDPGTGRRSGSSAGVRLESASPEETRLAEATLAEVRVPRTKGRPRKKPKRIIADKAYESDLLRERLGKRGIELIVPYRQISRHRRYEDGRSLRRCRRRWIVDRTTHGLGNSPAAGPS
jgi:transposase